MVIPIPIIIPAFHGEISDKAFKAIIPCFILLYIGIMVMITGLTWDGWKNLDRWGWELFLTGLFIWLAFISLPIGFWIYG